MASPAAGEGDAAAAAAAEVSAAANVTLKLESCPIWHVSVFNDRAEVTRRLVFSPAAVGELDVVCTGLTRCADPESLRMTALRGRCTILEVSSDEQRRFGAPDPEDLRKVEVLRAEVTTLEAEVARKRTQRQRVAQVRGLVDQYLATLVTGGRAMPSPGGSDRPLPALPGLDELGQALSFFEERTEKIDESAAACDEELASLEGKLAAARANCIAAGQPVTGFGVLQQMRQVSVKLEASSLDEIELQLVYMVTGASWTPSYDVRVTATDGAEASLSLSYFGLVQQATGEDWAGCRLSLSTAIPSRGGMPQHPPVRVVRWRGLPHPAAPVRARAQGRASGAAGILSSRNATSGPPGMQSCSSSMPQQACMAPQMMMAAPVLLGPGAPQTLMGPGSPGALTSSNVLVGHAFGPPPTTGPGAPAAEDESPPPEAAQAGVSERGGGHSTFVIERRVQIEADNQPHKVTIAALQLAPRFMYFATPELEENVYLQCRAINSSPYKLLGSARVSVFFNGGFVTTTSLRDTSPGEELMTFLGTDSGVKVEYRRISAKHTDTTSFMSSKQSTVYEYLTTVTNSKRTPIIIKVVGVVPRSQEEQIAVELTQPAPGAIVQERDVRAGEDAVMQNPVTNNVVWLRNVAASGKLELRLQYTVSWPRGKDIEVERER